MTDIVAHGRITVLVRAGTDNPIEKRDQMNKYSELGFESRKEYLTGLALENGLDPEAVHALAELLGPEEDFDGLLSDIIPSMLGSRTMARITQ